MISKRSLAAYILCAGLALTPLAACGGSAGKSNAAQSARAQASALKTAREFTKAESHARSCLQHGSIFAANGGINHVTVTCIENDIPKRNRPAFGHCEVQQFLHNMQSHTGRLALAHSPWSPEMTCVDKYQAAA